MCVFERVCSCDVLGPDAALGSAGHGGAGLAQTPYLPVPSRVRTHTCTPACAFLRACARPGRVTSLAAAAARLREELGWGWAAAPALTLASALHSCEERQKQEEEGGAQARVLRELHADA